MENSKKIYFKAEAHILLSILNNLIISNKNQYYLKFFTLINFELEEKSFLFMHATIYLSKKTNKFHLVLRNIF